MKLWTIFRFEFAYQVRRTPAWLYLAVLLGFTVVMKQLVTTGDGVYANNTFHITAMTVIGGLIWLVMAASVAGEAAARDMRTGMDALTHSSPVTKLDYLGGRFLAAFALNALLVLSLPAGILLSFYMPGTDPGKMGPFMPVAYLNVYFLIALPAAFVATALQFSLAALRRQVMAAYMASLLLALVAQVIAVAMAKLFGDWSLVKLLDPVGIAGIVGSELATWTPVEKNTRLVTLEGMFLWNRVLWLGIAVGLLALAYVRFSFGVGVTKKRRIGKGGPALQVETATDPAIIRSSGISVPRVHREFGYRGAIHQLLAIGYASFIRIIKNPVGLTLVAAVAITSAAFGSRIMTQFGIPLLPATQTVLGYLAAPPANLNTAWVVIPMLIIYFSGELVWAERNAGMGDLADASPVSAWALLAGKFLGMGLVMLIWTAMMMACGVGIQLSMNYHNLEIGRYLQVLFGLQLIDYLLFALLTLVVHVVVNQKHTGYLVMLLVFAFMAFPSAFGVEHKLLIFGSDTGRSYTDMRGFGGTLWPWMWFKLYWAGWALLLAVIARLLWARGREQGAASRLRRAARRFSGPARWLTATALVLIVTAGSYIFYHTNVQNEYLTASEAGERSAAYERSYGRYRNLPQPVLAGTRLWVDIFPVEHKADIRAVYTLVNRESAPIDSIHFGSVSGLEPVDISFDRPAVAVRSDKKLSHYIYALKQPLGPGDSIRLSFAVHYRQRGFRNGGLDGLVMEGGTHFNNFDMLPSIGYQAYRELDDAVLRNKYGLSPRPEIPSLFDAEARKKPALADQNSFEAIVSTSADEVAVAPGELRRTWTTGDRRFFHYRTDVPISGEYAFLSADYATKEDRWNDVAIRIYYHPGHDLNTGRMLSSAKTALEYYTRQFGPYPFRHLTLVEGAGSGDGASSEASMIDFGAQYALMNPDDSPKGFDLPYYILAHEVAHQWWGGASLRPANVEGAGVLVEGLAVYSGMQVLEKTYGPGHLQQYVRYLHSSYAMPRSLASASLLRADESFLYYRKGGLAMHALSRYIGKDRVNGAMRQMLQKHRSGALPLPTTPDLYEEIRKVTPDSLAYLLEDLFMRNTYWRLKTKKVSAERLGSGQWAVALTVEAQKVIVDSAGKEHDVPMNDWLEVGMYEQGKDQSAPFYLKKHRIRSGVQTITVKVLRRPDRAGIDPNMLMIDLRPDDNMTEVAGE